MGKSSSKKKRSKHLSQGKIRKKGKSLSKRYSKSKGIRSRNDSDSSADDSMSSGYELFSPASGDDNRNQRSRARLRKIDVKSSKKKDRRVFSSSESESESEQETARARKRKRSNKKDIIEPKKKNQRKKARRDETTSDSSSCSTTSHESESDRGRSTGRKKKDTRKMEKRKKKKRGYRSRSSSTSIVSSGSDDYQFEENTEPKRLRSVIIVVNDKEGTELDENEDKDMIIYDSPLREINGTDDCNNKREDTILSDEKTQNDLQNHIPDLAAETNTVEEISNEAVNVDVVASVDDLESILRERALENLKKFRGDLQTRAITTHADVKMKLKSDAMPNVKAEEIIGQTNSTKIEGVKLNAATKAPVLKRVFSYSARNEENRVEKNNKLDVVAVPDLSNKECSPTASAIGSKAKLAPLKEVNISINPAKKTEIEAGVDNRSSERAESVEHHSCKNNGNTVHKVSGSASVHPAPSLEPSLGNIGSNKDQSKEGSQLESKTMSVMRGGQMVEVNYQVYIPKKASALGRRPLKR